MDDDPADDGNCQYHFLIRRARLFLWITFESNVIRRKKALPFCVFFRRLCLRA